MIIVSAALVIGIFGKLPNLAQTSSQWTPFIFTIIGVTLYIMMSAKQRRERFDLKYLPDYCFRYAQAVIYLYVIMSIIAQTKTETYDFESWPPNLIGLFVGMFILHVEKAMEGLGQRFEEALAAILPRALTAKTSREKQLEKMRSEQKFKEIKFQSEMLASQIDDPGLKDNWQARLARVEATIRDGDREGIEDAVHGLAWDYESLKRSVREETATVDEILRVSRGKEPKPD
jgi:hypothetical protein